MRRRARPPLPAGASIVADSLSVLSILCLWLVAQLLILGGFSHDRAQAVLYREFRAELAAATAPTGGAIEPGAPVALLDLPTLGVQEVVVEGTASGDLLAGPGHRRDTALPGQEGVSVIYGRARTYGASFRDLASLAPGDPVVVTTQQGRVRFEVEGVRRPGDPLPDPALPGEARLTLATAESEGTLPALSASRVVYVDAVPAKDRPAFVPTPGRPVLIPAAERAMAFDPSALPLLVLSLAALMVATLAIVVARQRWSGVLVWVLASPVVMALAWVTTDVAVRLLPNLL